MPHEYRWGWTGDESSKPFRILVEGRWTGGLNFRILVEGMEQGGAELALRRQPIARESERARVRSRSNPRQIGMSRVTLLDIGMNWEGEGHPHVFAKLLSVAGTTVHAGGR